PRPGGRDPPAHGGGRLVVSQGGVEQHFGRRARELEEGDPPTPARKEARFLEVRDLAGARDRGHAPERDVLHVSDHRDAHAGSLERIRDPVSRVTASRAYFVFAAAVGDTAPAEFSGRGWAGSPCCVSAGGSVARTHPVLGFGRGNQRPVSVQVYRHCPLSARPSSETTHLPGLSISSTAARIRPFSCCSCSSE